MVNGPAHHENDPAEQAESLDIGALRTSLVRLSPGFVESLIEACAVCLDRSGHEQGISIQIDGMVEKSYILTWPKATPEMQAAFDDDDVATENGAYCVASLVLPRLTDYVVVRRSKKKTGFDWWLGREGSFLFQDAARMEVSGIRKGTNPQITHRLKKKELQTTQSDSMRIPAYAVVVEFSRPLSRIAQR